MDIETLYLHIAELIKAGVPKDTPVIITNMEGGFDAACAASLKKVIHYPTKGCEAYFHEPHEITPTNSVHKVIDQMVQIDAFVIADNDY